jgi:glyoxylase-like metal-dependent hydrolase (beta-lactamase superfamily II)
MVFYHSEEELLYVGDLLIKVGEKVVLPFPTLFPELMTKTLKKVAQFPVKKLLLAHGGVIEISDGASFFNELLLLVGRHGPAVFKLMEPFCSLAPDVQLYRKGNK